MIIRYIDGSQTVVDEPDWAERRIRERLIELDHEDLDGPVYRATAKALLRGRAVLDERNGRVSFRGIPVIVGT